MRKDNTIEAFFALVRVGLWGNGNPDIRIDETKDWNEVYRLATEQSVLGLVLAGLEHSDVKPPKELLLRWIGEVQMIEQRNKAMNQFIADLVSKMREAEIYTLLVKGQGLAQCYIKPLWRTCGDVDFFMSEDNYRKGKELLLPLSSEYKQERNYSKELGLKIDQWLVELHGTQRTGLSSRLDKDIDDLQKIIFYDGKVRSWMNDKTQVFLPAADEDVLIVFTHFLKHFYKGEGVSLRQICDWCRLLYTYRDSLNLRLLETRIRKMGLTGEWGVFADVAVKYLGMSKDAMPFYSESKLRHRRCVQIVNIMLHDGNCGRLKAACFAMKIFPISTIIYLSGILFDINWQKIKGCLRKKLAI